MYREAMFTDTMLETSWAQRSRRSLSTLTSFGLQAIVISLVILLSLLKSVVMPAPQTVSTPIFSGRAEPAPLASHAHAGPSTATPTNTPAIVMTQPTHVPTGIHSGGGEPSPQPPGGPGGGIYGEGFPTDNNLPMSILSGARPVVPVPPAPSVRVVRISTILEGNLIRRVQPTYPPLARSVRIQGPVVLAAVISKAGTIDNLHVLSGHPMLVPAAIDAVSKWRYRPYILNNEPVEVETQITVNFVLSEN